MLSTVSLDRLESEEVQRLQRIINRAKKEMWRYCYEYPHEDDNGSDMVTRILDEADNENG